MSAHKLDARRLLCPLPVIRVQDRVNRLKAGDRLEVVFTDPGALHDIPAWSRVNGHRVVATTEGVEHSHIVIEVGGAAPELPDPDAHG